MVQTIANSPKYPLNYKGSICSEMRGSITPKYAIYDDWMKGISKTTISVIQAGSVD